MVATVEKGPNYVFHLLAVARAGFDSGYADLYRRSVNRADLQALEGVRGRLAFADGHSGDLTVPAVLLPAYLGLESAAALDEYFDLLGAATGGGDGEPFLRRYAERLARTADWWERIDLAWLKTQGAQTGAAEALEALRRIYVRNFGAYEIVLVSATKNGPTANSLGYGRNVFYSSSDFDWLTQFISHETGTHILMGMLKAYVRPADGRAGAGGDTAPADPGGAGQGPDGPGAAPYGFDLVYQAFENLARLYNTLILGTADIYPMPDPDLSPREMLAVALRAISPPR